MDDLHTASQSNSEEVSEASGISVGEYEEKSALQREGSCRDPPQGINPGHTHPV